jgi:NCS2 family nucleobase:cation symporter-2/xanthine permease XanP
MQRVAYRQNRPIDFRSVQGALRADGIGNLLSGLFGTLPNTTYSTSISMVEFTGVSAPRVALYGGGLLVLLAFFPKVSAVLQAIPNPVVGAYLMILLAILFAAGGIRLLAHGGLNQENVILVGLSFWMGYAFQERLIFPQLIPEWLHTLLDNGMTAGGVTALILSGLFSLRQRRPDILDVPARTQSVRDIHRFLEARASLAGWDAAAIQRLQLVGEEALLFLVEDKAGIAEKPLRINLRFTESAALMEFITGASSANLESTLQSLPRVRAAETEIGPRLLRSMSTSVAHHQFDDGSYLALEVDSRPL